MDNPFEKSKKGKVAENMPLRSFKLIEEHSEGYKSFIYENLKLVSTLLKESNEKCVSCKLSIVYSIWNKPNKLEKQFLFFVLCKENDFCQRRSKLKLWQQIVKNTKMWMEHYLTKDERKSFQPSSGNTWKYKDEIVALRSEGEAHMLHLAAKRVKELRNFRNHILLIDRKLLHDGCNVFKTCITDDDNVNARLTFTLKTGSDYWTFDSIDSNIKFRLENISTVISGGLKEDIQCTTADVQEQEEEHNKESSESFFSGIVSGAPLQMSDCSSEAGHNNFASNLENIEEPSEFFETSNVEAVTYREGRIFSSVHDEYVLLNRCSYYKYFDSRKNQNRDSPEVVFVRECLQFACGCLNARKNGTIHFGVGDNENESCNFKYGEIVGFSVADVRQTLAIYKGALEYGIENCFTSEINDLAGKCISSPKLIRVFTGKKLGNKYVMEVDVRPSSHICKTFLFKVNLYNIRGINTTLSEDKYHLILRRGQTFCYLHGNEEKLFIHTELPQLCTTRKEEEEKKSTKSSLMNSLKEKPIYKLERLLCRGCDGIDPNAWFNLVLSRPSDDQKHSSEWIRSMSFIKNIKLTAVFDFDENSEVNGVSSYFRNKEESILLNEYIFKEYNSRFDELAKQFEIPYERKTLWVFCNGRSDQPEKKKHLQRKEWRTVYGAGVYDAVTFLSQNNVIPKGRAKFIIVLSSDEFEGLIDTFSFISSRFAWDDIILLAESENVQQKFAQKIKNEEICNSSQLDQISVIAPWEHINSVVNDLTGFGDKSECVVPVSNGHLIPIDEHTLQFLADLAILSAKQCENSNFKTIQQRSEYAYTCEIDFYQGKKVTWENFYFESHVLKRHNFDRIRERIQNILLQPRLDKRNVNTLTLSHEPGAGGSTLARHLLWVHRKEYKCCMITKVTERTAHHIIALWKWRETSLENAKPLLVLVDEVGPSEVTYYDFVKKNNTECRTDGNLERPICCVIFCRRDESLKNKADKIEIVDTSEVLSFYLKQELTTGERSWMELKNTELEKSGRDLGLAGFKPEHLISFMIMREGFNKDFIQSTISGLIGDLKETENEFQLLKYAALLSSYVTAPPCREKAYIPLECCDELMGYHVIKTKTTTPYLKEWWNRCSHAMKILLIVEEKENGSGMLIRMSHAVLAKAVMNEIKKKSEKKLSNIVMDYLDCSLLKTKSYGRVVLEELTKEMLYRRKKKENDEDNSTNFSPLIEDVIAGENYEKAVSVLEKGYRCFQDCFISQALARLFSKNKQHQEAVKWAEESVILAPKIQSSYCIHTWGTVMKEKFIDETNSSKSGSLSLDNVKDHIEFALKTFEIFEEAAKGRQDSDRLYPYYDQINMINNIARFLYDQLQLSKLEIKQYLIEDDFIPEFFPEAWKDIHGKLKRLQRKGELAHEILEQCTCFSTINYSNLTGDHNRFKSLLHHIPDLSQDFSENFGETASSPPENASIEMKNNWYRRKNLKLNGSSYSTIFSIITRVEKQKKERRETKDEALNDLKQIKFNLACITNKNSKDISNLVCVNVALGLLRGSGREPEQKLIKYCTQIIRNNTTQVDIAHLFICMLMWPSAKMKVEYDDDLFQASLKYLNDNYFRKKRAAKHQAPRNKVSFYMEEKNTSQPTTQFYLTYGEGIDSICNRCSIFPNHRINSEPFDAVWNDGKIKRMLKKLYGHVSFSSGSSTCIMIANEKTGGKPIEIRNIRGVKGILSEESVSFYLGFSIAGPVAYNIKHTRHETSALGHVERHDTLSDRYSKCTVPELEEMIQKINTAKEKRGHRNIGEREKTLIMDEEIIRMTLGTKLDSGTSGFT